LKANLGAATFSSKQRLSFSPETSGLHAWARIHGIEPCAITRPMQRATKMLAVASKSFNDSAV
jgi:hypothetical protein